MTLCADRTVATTAATSAATSAAAAAIILALVTVTTYFLVGVAAARQHPGRAVDTRPRATPPRRSVAGTLTTEMTRYVPIVTASNQLIALKPE